MVASDPFYFLKNCIMQYYLYLIVSGEFFKFGIAKSMKDRLKAYKTHNPIVDVYALWRGHYYDVKQAETAAINTFKKLRHKNSDWMKGNPLSTNKAIFSVIYQNLSKIHKLESLFISSNNDEVLKNQNSYLLTIDDNTVFEFVSIKVPNTKAIHFSKRTELKPNVGDECYVSFSSKYAHPCKYLGDAGNHGIGQMASIRIKCKVRGYDHNESHAVMYDELGLTPKQAITNTVTS